MQKNTKYTEGKKVLESYFVETEQLYQWLKETVDKYNNEPFENPEFAGFDYKNAVKFIRTFEIIKEELKPNERNLFCVFIASDYDYNKTLEIFNGNTAFGYKNIATLRVLICKYRKIIKEKYKEKYGTY